jgi:hypothetical protein
MNAIISERHGDHSLLIRIYLDAATPSMALARRRFDHE